MRSLSAAAAAVIALAWSGSAAAAVTDQTANGFEVRHVRTIAAPKAKVYAALLKPGAWWADNHSWSNAAKNMVVDLDKGCWCETLPNGFVRIMDVVYVDKDVTLQLVGGLGHLQITGASGALVYNLKDAGAGKTELEMTYTVGGYAKGGLESFAPKFDYLLGHGLERLQHYIETGKPE